MAFSEDPHHARIAGVVLGAVATITFAAIDAIEIIKHSIEAIAEPFAGCSFTVRGLFSCVAKLDEATLAGVIYHLAVPVGIVMIGGLVLRARFRWSTSGDQEESLKSRRLDPSPPGPVLGASSERGPISVSRGGADATTIVTPASRAGATSNSGSLAIGASSGDTSKSLVIQIHF